MRINYCNCTLTSLLKPASSSESSEDLRLDWKLLEFVRSRDVRIGSGVTLIVLLTSTVNQNIQISLKIIYEIIIITYAEHAES